jgi:CIC family chloride channel protein
VLVLIGMAAGLSAIFRSPVGTAFFAIEVLYSEMEFDAGVLLYTLLASIVAYAVNGLFVGWQPLFRVPADLPIPGFAEYLWYAVLGGVAGLVATLLPMAFYRIRDAFHAIPIPPHVKPAIGGLGVGLLALALPQVVGGGYGWIQEAIDGRLVTGLMLALIFGKILALSLTISSGGSGGVFAPSLFVGAMLGGFLAQLFHQPPAAFVVVGMAAVFAGAARVPIATLLMVMEMTGGFEMLVPAALAVTLSYVIQVGLSAPLKYKSLYEAQVPGRADSPAHRTEHLETALRLLRERRADALPTIGHLDLQALLASGIPVDLPGGKQLMMGSLAAQSPFVGQPVLSDLLVDDNNTAEVVAVFRDGCVLSPQPGVKLQVGDQMLIIASPQAQKQLTQHFIRMPQAR